MDQVNHNVSTHHEGLAQWITEVRCLLASLLGTPLPQKYRQHVPMAAIVYLVVLIASWIYVAVQMIHSSVLRMGQDNVSLPSILEILSYVICSCDVRSLSTGLFFHRMA
jgi:hypothetical protein